MSLFDMYSFLFQLHSSLELSTFFLRLNQRAYELFRAIGLRILVVVNRYNQCVGVISRDDLLAESLAQDMLTKGKVSFCCFLDLCMMESTLITNQFSFFSFAAHLIVTTFCKDQKSRFS